MKAEEKEEPLFPVELFDGRDIIGKCFDRSIVKIFNLSAHGCFQRSTVGTVFVAV